MRSETEQSFPAKPVIDYYALNGYAGAAGEGLYLLPGGLEEVKTALPQLVKGVEEQRKSFSPGENLSIVVFRGVFSTGGHGIDIERVDVKDNVINVHAVYTDPGPGMIVTQAFTQPAAFIPLGRLGRGAYEIRLLVTRKLLTEGGEKVLEEESEHARVSFKVE